MDNIFSIPWLVQTIALGILSLMFFWFKSWMASEFKEIKEHMAVMVSDKTCMERSGKCSAQQCRKINVLTTDVKEQWDALNSHGHKGLDGDDNKVVRT